MEEKSDGTDVEEMFSPSAKDSFDLDLSKKGYSSPLSHSPPEQISPSKEQALQEEISPVFEQPHKIKIAVGSSPSDFIAEEPEYDSADSEGDGFVKIQQEPTQPTSDVYSSLESSLIQTDREDDFEKEGLLEVEKARELIVGESPVKEIERGEAKTSEAETPLPVPAVMEEVDNTRVEYLSFDNMAFAGKDHIDKQDSPMVEHPPSETEHFFAVTEESTHKSPPAANDHPEGEQVETREERRVTFTFSSKDEDSGMKQSREYSISSESGSSDHKQAAADYEMDVLQEQIKALTPSQPVSLMEEAEDEEDEREEEDMVSNEQRAEDSEVLVEKSYSAEVIVTDESSGTIDVEKGETDDQTPVDDRASSPRVQEPHEEIEQSYEASVIETLLERCSHEVVSIPDLLSQTADPSGFSMGTTQYDVVNDEGKKDQAEGFDEQHFLTEGEVLATEPAVETEVTHTEMTISAATASFMTAHTSLEMSRGFSDEVDQDFDEEHSPVEFVKDAQYARVVSEHDKHLIHIPSVESIDRTESASMDSEDMDEPYGEQMDEMAAEMQVHITPSPQPPAVEEHEIDIPVEAGAQALAVDPVDVDGDSCVDERKSDDNDKEAAYRYDEIKDAGYQEESIDDIDEQQEEAVQQAMTSKPSALPPSLDPAKKQDKRPEGLVKTSSSSDNSAEPTLLAATYDLDSGAIYRVVAADDISPDTVEKTLPADPQAKLILSSPDDEVFESELLRREHRSSSDNLQEFQQEVPDVLEATAAEEKSDLKDLDDEADRVSSPFEMVSDGELEGYEDYAKTTEAAEAIEPSVVEVPIDVVMSHTEDVQRPDVLEADQSGKQGHKIPAGEEESPSFDHSSPLSSEPSDLKGPISPFERAAAQQLPDVVQGGSPQPGEDVEDIQQEMDDALREEEEAEVGELYAHANGPTEVDYQPEIDDFEEGEEEPYVHEEEPPPLQPDLLQAAEAEEHYPDEPEEEEPEDADHFLVAAQPSEALSIEAAGAATQEAEWEQEAAVDNVPEVQHTQASHMPELLLDIGVEQRVMQQEAAADTQASSTVKISDKDLAQKPEKSPTTSEIMPTISPRETFQAENIPYEDQATEPLEDQSADDEGELMPMLEEDKMEVEETEEQSEPELMALAETEDSPQPDDYFADREASEVDAGQQPILRPTELTNTSFNLEVDDYDVDRPKSPIPDDAHRIGIETETAEQLPDEEKSHSVVHQEHAELKAHASVFVHTLLKEAEATILSREKAASQVEESQKEPDSDAKADEIPEITVTRPSKTDEVYTSSDSEDESCSIEEKGDEEEARSEMREVPVEWTDREEEQLLEEFKGTETEQESALTTEQPTSIPTTAQKESETFGIQDQPQRSARYKRGGIGAGVILGTSGLMAMVGEPFIRKTAVSGQEKDSASVGFGMEVTEPFSQEFKQEFSQKEERHESVQRQESKIIETTKEDGTIDVQEVKTSVLEKKDSVSEQEMQETKRFSGSWGEDATATLGDPGAIAETSEKHTRQSHMDMSERVESGEVTTSEQGEDGIVRIKKDDFKLEEGKEVFGEKEEVVTAETVALGDELLHTQKVIAQTSEVSGKETQELDQGGMEAVEIGDERLEFHRREKFKEEETYHEMLEEGKGIDTVEIVSPPGAAGNEREIVETRELFSESKKTTQADQRMDSKEVEMEVKRVGGEETCKERVRGAHDESHFADQTRGQFSESYDLTHKVSEAIVAMEQEEQQESLGESAMSPMEEAADIQDLLAGELVSPEDLGDSSSVDSFATVVALQQEEEDRLAEIASMTSSFTSDMHSSYGEESLEPVEPAIVIDVRDQELQEIEIDEASSSSEKFDFAEKEELDSSLVEPKEDSSPESPLEEHYDIVEHTEMDAMPLATIREEDESRDKTSSSSSSRRDIPSSDSSEKIVSSPDLVPESPGIATGKFFNKSSERDDVSVSSSLLEFEHLESQLGQRDSIDSNTAVAEPVRASSMHGRSEEKDDVSISSSLAEFEALEGEMVGTSPESKSGAASSMSSLTEFEVLEREMQADSDSGRDRYLGSPEDGSFKSSNSSLNEFERLEQQVKLDEELEAEAQKVVSMLELGALPVMPAEHLSETDSHSDSHGSSRDLAAISASQEQLVELSSGSAEEAGPSKDMECKEEDMDKDSLGDEEYPRYQEIVQIIREASEQVESFQLKGQSQDVHSQTVPQEGESSGHEGDVDSADGMDDQDDSDHDDTAIAVAPPVALLGQTLTEDQIAKDIDADSLQDEESLSRSGAVDSDSLHDQDSVMMISAESFEYDHSAPDPCAEAIDPVDQMQHSADSLALVEDLLQHSGDSAGLEAIMQVSADSLGALAEEQMERSTDSLEPKEGIMGRSADSLEMEQPQVLPDAACKETFDRDSLHEEEEDVLDLTPRQKKPPTSLMEMSVESGAWSQSSSILSSETLRTSSESGRDIMRMSADDMLDLEQGVSAEDKNTKAVRELGLVEEHQEQGPEVRQTIVQTSLTQTIYDAEGNVTKQGQIDEQGNLSLTDQSQTSPGYSWEKRVTTYEPELGKVTYSYESSNEGARETVTQFNVEPKTERSDMHENITSPTPSTGSTHSDTCYCGPEYTSAAAGPVQEEFATTTTVTTTTKTTRGSVTNKLTVGHSMSRDSAQCPSMHGCLPNTAHYFGYRYRYRPLMLLHAVFLANLQL